MKGRLQRAIFLFRKAFSGRLTSGEQAEFDGLFENSFLRELYQAMGDDAYVERELARYFRYSPEEAFERFKQRHGRRGLRIRWGYGVGVAVGLLLLAVGIGIWKKINAPTPPAVSKAVLQKPGSGKAILRAVGERSRDVVLDREGMLCERPGTVVYYEGGQLSYVGKDSAVEQLSYDELIVPAGAECHVVLEDSTRVWLNSKSKLIYPTRFGREKREVYAEGEVYFEVRSDRRPFLVRSALGTVRVLGTAFGLTAYPNEPMLTTLISGKVAFLGLQRDLLALEPGYQVVVPLSGKPFVRPVDVEEFVSWKSGKYVFKARRLEEIMTVLQRWYDVVIFYQSERLKEIRFTGNVVRYDTIDTFLQVLEGTGELKYRMNGKTVILYQ